MFIVEFLFFLGDIEWRLLVRSAVSTMIGRLQGLTPRPDCQRAGFLAVTNHVLDAAQMPSERL